MAAPITWKGFLGFGFGLANFALLAKAVSKTDGENGVVDKDLPNIAIIGAGIGGTSSAFHLRQLFGKETNIDVYEPGHVGGRIKAVEVDGHFYESGASIIHAKNEYMVNFAKMLGLKHREKAPNQILGLFDGENMVFKGSSWDVLFAGKLLWRYGLSVVKLHYWVENMMTHFKRIYAHQDDGHAFTNVEKLLTSMSPEFVELTGKSIRQAFTEAGMSKRFIDEIVMIAMRNNYGQTPDIHAFVGSVSLSGIQPGLWSVHGGNQQVPQKLLENLEVILIQSEVKQIKLLPTDKLQYQITTSEGKAKVYDIVIVAAPQHQKSQIEFLGFPEPLNPVTKYHRTVTNFAAGLQNKKLFNLADCEIVNDITTTKESVFFNTFARNVPVDYKSETSPDGKTPTEVWKSFSQVPLTDEQVDKLYESHGQRTVVDWLAYPEFQSAETLPSFVLHDRLFYLNAIERAASAMEMSAIGGRNVALLAFNKWYKKYDKIDSDSVMPKIVPKKKKQEL